jgi:serine/threonine protein kinase
VKLLDFGAAREFAESGNKSLSILLKPGYAPEEQYRSRGQQGPWTDIYALCATMYKAITGVTPDESSERMRMDEVKVPSALGVVLPPAQQMALMKGMAVLQENRWKSIDELVSALYGKPVPLKPDHLAPVPPKLDQPKPIPPKLDDPEPIPQPAPETKPNPFVSWITRNKVAAGSVAAMMVVMVSVIVWAMGNADSGSPVMASSTVSRASSSAQSVAPASSVASAPESSEQPDTSSPESASESSTASAPESSEKPQTITIGGQIVDVGVTELELMSRDISDISELAGLTNLGYLMLSFNNIIDISALAGLTNLEELNLSYNNIIDISTLAGLTNLEKLLLHSNNISDISALKGLTNLEALYLDDNPLTQSQVDELREALPNCTIYASDLTVTTTEATTEVTTAELIAWTRMAVNTTMLSDSKTASVRIKNAKSVSVEALKAMASTASGYGLGAQLNADIMRGDTVSGRITINPAKVTGSGDVQLGVYVDDDHVEAMQDRFERSYQNDFRIIYLTQDGGYGMTVYISAKLDLVYFDTSNLYFYSYNPATDEYKTLTNTNAKIDNNGYIQFQTDTGNFIIVSEGALVRK